MSSEKKKSEEKKIVRERPLSPHLTIYKPQITSVLSIMHRVTGVFLFIGAFVLVWWLASVACSMPHYKFITSILTSPVGKLFLLGWSFSMFFHMANGVRHLFWDIGMGYNLSTVEVSGWVVVIFSVFSTVAIWLIV